MRVENQKEEGRSNQDRRLLEHALGSLYWMLRKASRH